MKFSSKHTGYAQMTAVEVIAREALSVDPYVGGTFEHLQAGQEQLRQVVCAIIPMLPEETQEALVAHFAPSYRRVEGT